MGHGPPQFFLEVGGIKQSYAIVKHIFKFDIFKKVREKIRLWEIFFCVGENIRALLNFSYINMKHDTPVDSVRYQK